MEAYTVCAQKKQYDSCFRDAEVELQVLKLQAQREEIKLPYVDESGFTQAQPNCSAWNEKGEQHMIEAKRGKRLNVLGALLSPGRLFAARLWDATTALKFAGFLGLLLEQISKTLVVVLDNASVHNAKLIQPLLDVLKLRGLHLNFLPPCSSELNRIEKL